jgi:hypothetical protein
MLLVAVDHASPAVVSSILDCRGANTGPVRSKRTTGDAARSPPGLPHRTRLGTQPAEMKLSLRRRRWSAKVLRIAIRADARLHTNFTHLRP